MADTAENRNEASSPAPRRLLRSRDRVIFGVAAGLADYFRIDPTLVRVGFVVATLFGGFGVLPYVILALVVPMDDGSGRPERRDRPPTGLIVLAAIVLLVFLPGPIWGPWDHAHWGGWWWAWSGGWLLLVGLGALGAYLIMRGRGRDAAERDSGGETTATAQVAGWGAGAERTTEVQPQPRSGPHPVVRAVGIALIAIAALCAACAIATLSAWTVATGNGEIAAGIVIALGAAVAAAAIGGARVAPWLIIPALVVALPAGAMAASEIRFDGDFGEREYSPTSVAEIPEEGYRLGVGQLTLDLQQLDIRPGQTVRVSTDLGAGRSIVSVPRNACLEVDAHGSAGELYVRGQRSEGVDPDLSANPPRTRAPRIVLDADIDLGQLLVSERPADELQASGEDRRFGSATELDDSAERDDAEQACRT
jgi:phage shock protein PspC (stress-responsive transcriptional regulator)